MTWLLNKQDCHAIIDAWPTAQWDKLGLAIAQAEAKRILDGLVTAFGQDVAEDNQGRTHLVDALRELRAEIAAAAVMPGEVRGL